MSAKSAMRIVTAAVGLCVVSPARAATALCSTIESLGCVKSDMSEETHRWKGSETFTTGISDDQKKDACCEKMCVGNTQAKTGEAAKKECDSSGCIANFFWTVNAGGGTGGACAPCPDAGTNVAGTAATCQVQCAKITPVACSGGTAGDKSRAWALTTVEVSHTASAAEKATACCTTVTCKTADDQINDGNGPKQKCDADGCQIDFKFTSAEGRCTACGKGKFAAGNTDATCSDCDKSCDSCVDSTAAKCKKCADGYFAEGVDTPTGQPCGGTCQTGCATCTKATNEATNDLKCTGDTCADGYYPKSGNTQGRECAKCTDGCETCTKATTTSAGVLKCTGAKCATGYYSKSGTNSARECVKCHSSCSTCEGAGASKCTACKKVGEKIKDGKCASVAMKLNPLQGLAALMVMLVASMSQ